MENGQSTYTVTAMRETLERSNLGLLRVGDEVNVERSMLMNGRLDGHIVQGHVDQTATCIAVEDQQGSYQYTFKYESTKDFRSASFPTPTRTPTSMPSRWAQSSTSSSTSSGST